eukprot:TRINITY_DN24360_c0_g1_i3.p1 TRINITY_DN24360_c0_g1~~TRINITY_DN24360_c0_g1_i3.p1  ORF type:complete len:1127 (+),score=248.55 TRINITY_DN24360_c0_g1_i3:382-3762(+)
MLRAERKRQMEQQLKEEQEELAAEYGTLHVALDKVIGLPQEEQQQQLGSLAVKILNGKGLRRAESGARPSDPLCTCEITGKPHTRVSTRTAMQTTEPVWDESREIPDFAPSDSLLIKVFDGKEDGDLIGQATLPSDQFCGEGGFDADVRLLCTGRSIFASVRLQVHPVVAKVIIKYAQGLRRKQGYPKADAYCVCEVLDQPFKTFQTDVQPDALQPQWMHRDLLTGIKPSDTLSFKVFHRDKGDNDDELLGCVKLPCSECLLGGLNKDLILEDTPVQIEATLRVQINVSATALFCTYEFENKPHSKVHTSFTRCLAASTWDHECIVPFYTCNDTLLINLWRQSGIDQKVTALARCRIGSHQFTWPQADGGFDGSLQLQLLEGEKPPTSAEADPSEAAPAAGSPQIKLRIYLQEPPSHGTADSTDEDDDGVPDRVQRKDYLAILNRQDFERVVGALEQAAMHPYAAAAELRAAERRSGAAREKHSLDPTSSQQSQVHEVRQTFSQLKGFLGFAFSVIDRSIKVADPVVRNEELTHWRQVQAARKIQNSVRQWQALKSRRKLYEDLRNRIMYDCFHIRCGAPPSVGLSMDISVKHFYMVSEAHIILKVLQPSGKEERTEIHYTMEAYPDGKYLFKPMVEDEETTSGIVPRPFAGTVTGTLGKRRLRVGDGFPVVGTFWDHLPVFVETHTHNDAKRNREGEKEEAEDHLEGLSDGDDGDAQPSEWSSSSSTSSSGSGEDSEIIYSGWLEVLGTHKRFTWRYCTLSVDKLCYYAKDDLAVKRGEMPITRGLELLPFRDNSAPFEVQHFRGERQHGFVVAPCGWNRRLYFFDAHDVMNFREWSDRIWGAVAAQALLAGERPGLPQQRELTNSLQRQPPQTYRNMLSQAEARHVQVVLQKHCLELQEDPARAMRRYDPQKSGFLLPEAFKIFVRKEMGVRPLSLKEAELESLLSALQHQQTGAIPIAAVVDFMRTGQLGDRKGDEDVDRTDATAASSEARRSRAKRGAIAHQPSKMHSVWLQSEPQKSSLFCVAMFRGSDVEGWFEVNETKAKALFMKLEPKYKGYEGIEAMIMLGKFGEELRYFGSRLVIDQLLIWRELNLPKNDGLANTKATSGRQGGHFRPATRTGLKL